MLQAHLAALALPFLEPVEAVHEEVIKAKAEAVAVKNDHQNRLLYVECHLFPPLSMALVTDGCLGRESSCTSVPA